MGDKSSIEWTEATWNPIRGCSRVSEGCRHCYAERVAMRFSGPGQPYEGLVHIANGHPQWTGKVQFVEKHLADPLKWKQPRRIFVNSMSDLFHDSVSDAELLHMFTVMGNSHIATGNDGPTHTFQILTKRPKRMQKFMSQLRWKVGLAVIDYPGWSGMLNFMPYLEGMKDAWRSLGGGGQKPDDKEPGWQPKNIWMGVSCENQATADERIALLVQTPAAVRWVSAEPLLGPIDFTNINAMKNFFEYMAEADPAKAIKDFNNPHYPKHCPLDALAGTCPVGEMSGVKIDWIVVGGESGPGARPMHPDWARSIRDQCQAAGVPFFFKQWGEWCPYSPTLHGNYKKKRFMHHDGRTIGPFEPNPDGMDVRDWSQITKVGKKAAGRLLDGHEWNEYPQLAEAAHG